MRKRKVTKKIPVAQLKIAKKEEIEIPVKKLKIAKPEKQEL